MQFQYFDNIRFRLDKKTGYYISSKMILGHRQERMHRYVWKHYYFDIPQWYHIHHKNGDKSDNRIENLEILSNKDHIRLHSVEYHKNNKEKVNSHMNSIRPLTKKWHGSKKGSEWHKFNYENMKDKLYKKEEKKCEKCHIIFFDIINAKFCSNNCKSAYRRKNGLDNIIKICEYCEKKYESNKYAKNRTCSRSCGKLFIHKNKINSKDRISLCL